MSRSRRKTPITGYTKTESDAAWKAKAARAVRSAVRAKLGTDADDALLPVKRWAVVDPWDAPKDGKCWFEAAAWPKDMRK